MTLNGTDRKIVSRSHYQIWQFQCEASRPRADIPLSAP